MRGYVRCVGGVVALTAVLLGGCTGAKVNEQLAEPAALRDSQQAIALIRLEPPDPACQQLAVQLGTREGQFYKLARSLKLEQIAVTKVAEVMLPPGEYHVISFVCIRARSQIVIAEQQGNGLARRSYASFTLAAGEVVNLGQLQSQTVSRSSGVHNSFVHVTLGVTDWPLAELEKFKSQRPKLYAEMKTRLMTVPTAEPTTPAAVAEKCADLKRLQAEGKVQNLHQRNAKAFKHCNEKTARTDADWEKMDNKIDALPKFSQAAPTI